MRKTSFSAKCCLISRVQLLRRLEVVPERLLDDQPDPAFGAAPLRDLLDERPDRARRHREVVDPVPLRAALRVELVSSSAARPRRVVGEVERDVRMPAASSSQASCVERVARVLLRPPASSAPGTRRRSPRCARRRRSRTAPAAGRGTRARRARASASSTSGRPTRRRSRACTVRATPNAQAVEQRVRAPPRHAIIGSASRSTGVPAELVAQRCVRPSRRTTRPAATRCGRTALR